MTALKWSEKPMIFQGIRHWFAKGDKHTYLIMFDPEDIPTGYVWSFRTIDSGPAIIDPRHYNTLAMAKLDAQLKENKP